MLLANPKQLPDPQVNRLRPPAGSSTEGHTCGSLHFGGRASPADGYRVTLRRQVVAGNHFGIKLRRSTFDLT